jgi:hypothetical protein
MLLTLYGIRRIGATKRDNRLQRSLPCGKIVGMEGMVIFISYLRTENIARQHPVTGLVKYRYERELGNVRSAQNVLYVGSLNVNGC